MRKCLPLLLLCIVTLGNFYCSDSPFDDATNLGSDIIRDKDSLLTVFDGKISKDSLTAKPGHSLVDRTIKDKDPTDSIISGLHGSSSLAVGTWQNENAFVYMTFSMDSIRAWTNSIDAGTLAPLSLDLLFSNDAAKSDASNNVTLEIGYYAALPKPKSTLIDTLKLTELTHYTYNSSIDTAFHTVPLKKDYLLTTDAKTIQDTSTIRFVNSHIDTIIQDMVPVDTIHLSDVRIPPYTLYKNEIVLYHNPTTNADSIGRIEYLLDTIRAVTIYPKNILIYDSLTPKTSLITKNQIALYVNRDTIIDTSIQNDTVITTPQTTTTYKINTNSIHVITHGDTVDEITYDTVQVLTIIIQDSVFQKSVFTTKQAPIAFIPQNSDTLALYIRLDPSNSPSLQFITNPSLRLRYLNATKTDTITRSLKPFYADYSVFENNEPAMNAMAVSSGAAGRYAVVPIDLQPLINAVSDSATNQILYSNFLQATVTIQFDSLSYHTSLDSIYFYYALSAVPLNHISEITAIPPKIRSSRFVNRTSTSISIDINSYLVSLVKKSTDPSTAYLYCWLPGTHFSHIYWKAHDTEIPITYIISNSP